MYQLTAQKDLHNYTADFKQKLIAQELGCETAVVDMMKQLLAAGLHHERLVALPPADYTDSQKLIWRQLVMYSYVEVFRAAPHADVSPTQCWSMLDQGSAPMPVLRVEPADELTPTEPSGALIDEAEALLRVSALLNVPVAHLVIPTPPDGLCLYHCFTAAELGSSWLRHRDASGFCQDRQLEKIHRRLAKALQRRLVYFLLAVFREHQAARLRLPGAAGYPGADELPYLAELLSYDIVEHDLVHPNQPTFRHQGGGRGAAVHIGFMLTSTGAPHWVLLRDHWPAGHESDESASETPTR